MRSPRAFQLSASVLVLLAAFAYACGNSPPAAAPDGAKPAEGPGSGKGGGPGDRDGKGPGAADHTGPHTDGGAPAK